MINPLFCHNIWKQHALYNQFNGSVIAVLKFLKLDPAKKKLPHPSGPLFIIIPTSSIAALALHAFITY